MLELQNLSFAVDDESGNKEIVQDVSLVIPDRKFVVITGPNGGGKSTLAKLIAGVLKPTEGRILLDGEDITELSITDRARRGIAFAFQQPVRFKGIQVFDLIRLASGKSISVADACEYATIRNTDSWTKTATRRCLSSTRGWAIFMKAWPRSQGTATKNALTTRCMRCKTAMATPCSGGNGR